MIMTALEIQLTFFKDLSIISRVVLFRSVSNSPTQKWGAESEACLHDALRDEPHAP